MSNYFFIKTRIFYLFFALIASIGLSAQNWHQKAETDEKYLLIKSILKDSLNVKHKPEHILILHEHGCIKCNQAIADFIYKHSSADALFIISNTGVQVDYSKLLDLKQDNLIYDYLNYFFRNGVMANSSIYIKIEEDKVDTIIHLSAKELSKNLNYIEKNIGWFVDD